MILMYHNIDRKIGFITISQLNFEQQMDYLLQSDYKLVSLDQYINLLNKNSRAKDIVSITFDDAYISFQEIVIPILEKFKIPATLFVPTGHVGSFNVWDKELTTSRLELMNWAQLKAISNNPLLTMGSHGVSHMSLSSLNNEEIKNEILQSKKQLEQELEITIRYFSYPYGQHRHFNAKIIKTLKECGYYSACSTNWNRYNTVKNLYKLNRIEIEPADTLTVFVNKIRRKYHYKFFKQLVKNCLQ